MGVGVRGGGRRTNAYHGSVRFGSVRFGSVGFGSVGFGSVRYGSVPFGTANRKRLRPIQLPAPRFFFKIIKFKQKAWLHPVAAAKIVRCNYSDPGHPCSSSPRMLLTVPFTAASVNVQWDHGHPCSLSQRMLLTLSFRAATDTLPPSATSCFGLSRRIPGIPSRTSPCEIRTLPSRPCTRRPRISSRSRRGR